jgi:hypothetical protein
MALRDKLKENASHLLQTGETVQVVIPARSKSPYVAGLGLIVDALLDPNRAIVVTDRRIMLCHAGRVSRMTIKEATNDFRRETRIGPASGVWYKCDTLGDRLYIHKRFHKDIAEADAAIPTAT